MPPLPMALTAVMICRGVTEMDWPKEELARSEVEKEISGEW